mgnify:CR=1 FL=1
MNKHEQAHNSVDEVAVAGPGTQRCWNNEHILHNYIKECETTDKELQLYKQFFNSLKLRIEHDSTDDGWGGSEDFCALVSDNKDVEFYDARVESIELFNKLSKVGDEK